MKPKEQHTKGGLTRRRFLGLGLGLGTGLGVGLSMGWPAALVLAGEPDCLAIRARVWPGLGGPVLEDGLVLVRGGRIEEVAPWGSRPVPPGADLLDGRGRTLIPGLIDAHTHQAWSPETRRTDYLERGITSLGDLAAPLDKMADLARDRLPAGHPLGGSPTARAAYAGPMLCAPGGYPLITHGKQWGLPVSSPKEAALAVQRLAGLGATLLKLGFEPGAGGDWPLLDRDTAREAVREAHALGLTVRCHCQDLLGLERALDMGVDVIEHVPSRWTTPQGGRPVYQGDAASARPGPRLEELVRGMAGQGTAWCPTLGVGAATSWLVRGMQRAVGLFHELGGRVALGTDVPFLAREPGPPVAEMALLAGCGLDNGQVLATATENAALVCGFTGLGRLSPGRVADMLLLDADPLSELANVALVRAVVARGRAAVSAISS